MEKVLLIIGFTVSRMCPHKEREGTVGWYSRFVKLLSAAAVALVTGALLLSGLADAEGRGLTVRDQREPSGNSCAKALPAPPEANNPRSDHILVPPFAQQVMLCRYFGSGRHYRLAGAHLIRTNSKVAILTREFDGLKPSTSHGYHSCFFDDGAALYAIFSYEGEPEVPVRVKLSGCESASNGRYFRGFPMTTRLTQRLMRLTRMVDR
jgi:hypothetical protein